MTDQFTKGVIKDLTELFKLVPESKEVQAMAFRLAQVESKAYCESDMDESETADLLIAEARVQVAAGVLPSEIAGD